MVGKAKVQNESIMYSIRIHQCDGVDDNGIASFCSDLDGAYFMAKETEANRIHYQGWIISGLKEITIRMRIKKAFPTTVGNKGYSITVCKDPESYMKYICKGTRECPPEVVVVNGIEYNKDWIQCQWESFWKDERSTAYEMKKAKQSADEIVWEKVEKLDNINPRNVLTIIVDVYTTLGKKFDMFQLKRFCNVIMSKYDKQFRKRLVDSALMDDLYSAYDAPKELSPDNIKSQLDFDWL